MTRHIEAFFHCSQCIKEKPDGVSPRDWARFEIGWTVRGLQVWCARHDKNIVHIDFLGQKVRTDQGDDGDFEGVPKIPGQ